jgi:hypothetical protein
MITLNLNITEKQFKTSCPKPHGLRIKFVRCRFCGGQTSRFFKARTVCSNCSGSKTNCLNCGKEIFKYKNTHINRCCSHSCNTRYRIKNNIGRQALNDYFDSLHIKFSGSGNPAWRGGVTPENKRIRKSKEYDFWRKSVFERDGYKCVECGSGGKLQADHIKPFSTHEKLRFDLSNGRTLCVSCHRKTDTYGSKAFLYKDVLN